MYKVTLRMTNPFVQTPAQRLVENKLPVHFKTEINKPQKNLPKKII